MVLLVFHGCYVERKSNYFSLLWRAVDQNGDEIDIFSMKKMDVSYRINSLGLSDIVVFILVFICEYGLSQTDFCQMLTYGQIT